MDVLESDDAVAGDVADRRRRERAPPLRRRRRPPPPRGRKARPVGVLPVSGTSSSAERRRQRLGARGGRVVVVPRARKRRALPLGRKKKRLLLREAPGVLVEVLPEELRHDDEVLAGVEVVHEPHHAPFVDVLARLVQVPQQLDFVDRLVEEVLVILDHFQAHPPRSCWRSCWRTWRTWRIWRPSSEGEASASGRRGFFLLPG
mmetsp:Transcript_19803/g.63685  ORF Transcript_19803/g.63685 Transcript_19803/m.63685 type:complete len:203 (-) Transcript_19803:899-1507(-)